jgi:hypothetical protein
MTVEEKIPCLITPKIERNFVRWTGEEIDMGWSVPHRPSVRIHDYENLRNHYTVMNGRIAFADERGYIWVAPDAWGMEYHLKRAGFKNGGMNIGVPDPDSHPFCDKRLQEKWDDLIVRAFRWDIMEGREPPRPDYRDERLMKRYNRAFFEQEYAEIGQSL